PLDGKVPETRAARVDRLAQLAGDRSLADFEALLGHVDDDPSARSGVALGLPAYLELHLEACDALERTLRAADPTARATRMRLDALAAAGHAPAQLALVHTI